MKKIFSVVAAALMSINAWSFDNVAATFTWTVGNEAEATVASDAADGVKETKRKVGTALTEGTRNNFDANPGVAMVTYNPTAGNAGAEASVMVEYRVKMKKGVTFTLSEISYDAIKQGTDNASYHWSYVVDGTESTPAQVSKDDIRRDNNTAATAPALRHTHAVTATAGREVSVRFYVSGFNTGKLFCLDSIRLVGTVNGEEEVRAFTDFKIEFRTNPSQVILPTTGVLPAGVAVEGTAYNGDQHGIQGGTITVPVDGPVKFTFGACQYSTTTIEIKKDGVHYATFSNNASCGEKTPNYNQNVTWLYNVEEAATLTFELGSQTYLPYFFAEACEFVPSVEVRYFDTDGSLLGSEVVDGSSALVYKYGAADVKVADGFAFRGWFNGDGANALKVPAGTSMNEDISLYAKATEIEIPAMGKIFNYDLRPKSFYPEDHEVLVFDGGAYNDATHGWRFGNGNTLGIKVAGNALIVVGVCRYSHTGDTELRDAENNLIGKLTTVNNSTPDGELQSISYTGDATTLTFHFTATDYIHSIKVYNIVDLPQKDDYGYYEVAPGDAAGLILTLESMAAGEKVFLPNGVYDLGDACLTTISKNNVSIIGQSMEGTIIKNTPIIDNEGISTTATFLITAENTYLQDLTLWNNLDYFAALAKLNNGRGVCLQDKGTKTICKNVRMLSNQDTYYSNKQGAVKYFEDCEIHGTVDFICGDGSVYFYGTELICEQRNANGGGADAVTASNAAATDKGYVFDHCTIRYAEGIQGNLPVVSLGRAWNNAPQCVFLYTFLDDSNGELVMTKDASLQKDKVARWTLGAMNALPQKFGEFCSVDKNANIISPASNNVTFVYGSTEKQMETILSVEDAQTYTVASTLGEWGATAVADAEQAECEEEASNYEADGIYLVEADGAFAAIIRGSEFMTNFALYDGVNYTVRKANARGGFGLPAGGAPQGIENTAAKAAKATKIIRNGQVIIVRDGKEYNVLGAQL